MVDSDRTLADNVRKCYCKRSRNLESGIPILRAKSMFAQISLQP
jgi:hypothetical protein